MKQKIDIKKYKEFLNLLWIIPIIIIAIFVNKNFNLLEHYYLKWQNEGEELIFSVFNKSMSNDTFFTLAIGKNVLENGNDNMDHLTWHNNLSYPHSGIFDIIIYSIYNKYDFKGLANFVTIMIIITAIILFFVIKNGLSFAEKTDLNNIDENNSKEKITSKKLKILNSVISAIFVVIAIYLCRRMFVVRAQIFSFILFLLEFLFIEKLLKTGRKIYSVILIVIPIIIANIHSSVYLVYFVFYLPYIAEFICYKMKKFMEKSLDNSFINNENKILKEDLLCKKENKIYGKLKKIIYKIFCKFEIEKRENLKILLVTAGISLFTGLLTTTGLAPYTDMIKAMGGVSTEFIGELSHSTLENNAIFYYIFICFILCLFIPKTKPKITDVFYILGFGIMTISTYRSMYYFVLIGSTPIARTFLNIIKVYNIKIKYKIIKFALGVGMIAVFCICYGMEFFRNQLTSYVDEENFPVKASDYILENVDIANMRIFNNFNYGSYLEFRGIPAFIDSRSGMFTQQFNEGVTILEDWLLAKENEIEFEKVVEKYEITHIITRKSEEIYNFVNENKDWNLIYNDSNFYLYERNWNEVIKDIYLSR